MSNDSVVFIELLGEYIRMFVDFDKNQEFVSGLMILISFGTVSKKPQVRLQIQKLLEDFGND